ncbi:hypothetical protein [Actinomyces radicidentis]|uniref:hypothetical protein n=1 Tax=Actinomyces radicidentis TaxID=111015 RepID=UPI0012372EE7|nr:hypothetical protein [Actinomyces radicidentis]
MSSPRPDDARAQRNRPLGLDEPPFSLARGAVPAQDVLTMTRTSDQTALVPLGVAFGLGALLLAAVLSDGAQPDDLLALPVLALVTWIAHLLARGWARARRATADADGLRLGRRRAPWPADAAGFAVTEREVPDESSPTNDLVLRVCVVDGDGRPLEIAPLRVRSTTDERAAASARSLMTRQVAALRDFAVQRGFVPRSAPRDDGAGRRP